MTHFVTVNVNTHPFSARKESDPFSFILPLSSPLFLSLASSHPSLIPCCCSVGLERWVWEYNPSQITNYLLQILSNQQHNREREREEAIALGDYARFIPTQECIPIITCVILKCPQPCEHIVMWAVKSDPTTSLIIFSFIIFVCPNLTTSLLQFSSSSLLFPVKDKILLLQPLIQTLTLLLLKTDHNPARKTFSHHFSLIPRLLRVNLISSPNPLSFPFAKTMVYALSLSAAAVTLCLLWLHLFLFILPSLGRFIRLILSLHSLSVLSLYPRWHCCSFLSVHNSLNCTDIQFCSLDISPFSRWICLFLSVFCPFFYLRAKDII